MENLLLKYFEARIKTENENRPPGPVITISREYGCPSKILADILVQKLNLTDPESGSHPFRWKWISRELLEESAKDLKVDPRHINHIFDYHERSMIDDILASTRKDGTYKSDHAIKKTIGRVVRAVAERGHVVIVGRAGVALARDIRKSLHIRLMAPLEWRLKGTMETQSMTREKALELLNNKDSNRKRFLEYYLGQKFSIQIFDVVYNCAFLTLEEIADSVLVMAGQHKLI